MSLLITNEQKVKLTINAVTAANRVAPLDGVPTWSVSDSAVLSLDVAPDGLSAYAISNGVGVSQVSVIADADLGAGIRELATFIEIQVIAAEAVSLGFVAGTPEVK